jgi:hypothetical protein
MLVQIKYMIIIDELQVPLGPTSCCSSFCRHENLSRVFLRTSTNRTFVDANRCQPGGFTIVFAVQEEP